MVAFQLQDSSSDTDWNFAMFIPENSPARSVVDVMARWEENRNYAPLVRQGNYLLVGLAAPEATWTTEYRQFFRQLALALRDRKPELFTEAKWEITKPGRDYRFELGKARETNRLFGQTYYFQFTKPTTFRARLQHEGSKRMMLLFMGKNREHWTRTDAKESEPLDIHIDITQDDIARGVGAYWRLQITNFDAEHSATCSLSIQY
jgi:hypothetical protein